MGNLRIAQFNQDQGWHQDALKFARFALTAHTDAPMAHAVIGKSSFVLGDWAEAETHLRRATALHDQLPEAHFLLSLILYKKDLLDEAGWHFQQSIQLSRKLQRAPSSHSAPLLCHEIFAFHSARSPWQNCRVENGTEFCGAPERHEYDLCLKLEDIEHTRTKARDFQTHELRESSTGIY